MKLLFTAIILLSATAYSKVKIEKIEYKDGDTVLEGAVLYDSSLAKSKKKLPGIIIIHDWMGVGDYVMTRAQQVAELGYVAFVADIYGKGVRPHDATEAGALSSKYKTGDRKEMRSRAMAAFKTFKANEYVNADKISAMGYCFGGTVALEMARLGLSLTGVISFHGGLSSVSPKDAENIKTKLLVLHGAIDPYVTAAEVSTFQNELNAANVNYEFVAYSGAVHAFTIKSAGNDIKVGTAYNEQADRRSFIAMKNFLTEVNK